MATAVVGAGNIGGTVARLLSASGEPVVLAAGNVPTDRAREIGNGVTASTVPDALARADVVVLAVWLDVTKKLLADNAGALAGKVVVDTSNPIAPGADGGFTRTLPDGVSSGSVIAELTPGSAHFAKAFGTLAAPTLAASAQRSPRGVLFYATDDDTARAAVERLITAAGYDPVRAGGVDASLRIEVGGDLHELGGLDGRVLDSAQARAAVRSGA